MDLKQQLLTLHAQQECYLKEKYDRSLSFQDGMFDRFDRAGQLGFGDGASIYNSALVYGQVKVGKKTWVGPYVILDGSGGGIDIGAYCSISAGVNIYTHDSVDWALSGGKSPYNKGSVSIGDNTYIGAQSIIKMGVTIGRHCLIGANTFVNRNVADYAIIAGNPGKIIGRVDVNENGVFLKYDE